MIHERSLAYKDFSYFTVITYWGLAFYFFVASIHTFCVARWGYSLLQRWPKIFQFLHSLYYTTIVTFPFLVSAVYWGILYKGPWFPKRYDAWSNISVHAMNSLYALFEIVFTRTNRMPWLHIPFLIAILGGYLGIAYITYDTEHFYVYSFLDPSTHGSGRVVAYVFGILAAAVIAFVLVWLLIWGRSAATRRSDKKYAAEFEHRHVREKHVV